MSFNTAIAEHSDRYLPLQYPEERPFWEAARQGVLKLQRCPTCKGVWYPIGPVCPSCLSKNFEWAAMSGRGKVVNYVVYHKAWASWLKEKLPYAVVLVQLDEGPILTGNLLDIPASAVRIGMEAHVVFEDVSDEASIVQFRSSIH